MLNGAVGARVYVSVSWLKDLVFVIEHGIFLRQVFTRRA